MGKEKVYGRLRCTTCRGGRNTKSELQQGLSWKCCCRLGIIRMQDNILTFETAAFCQLEKKVQYPRIYRLTSIRQVHLAVRHQVMDHCHLMMFSAYLVCCCFCLIHKDRKQILKSRFSVLYFYSLGIIFKIGTVEKLNLNISCIN